MGISLKNYVLFSISIILMTSLIASITWSIENENTGVIHKNLTFDLNIRYYVDKNIILNFRNNTAKLIETNAYYNYSEETFSIKSIYSLKNRQKGRYIEKLDIERKEKSFHGSLIINKYVDKEYLFINTVYNIVKNNKHYIVKYLNLSLNTTIWKELLYWNITYNELMLKYGEARYGFKTLDNNNVFILMITVKNLVFESNDKQVLSILGIPSDQDLDIVFSSYSVLFRNVIEINVTSLSIERLVKCVDLEPPIYNEQYIVLYTIPFLEKYVSVLGFTRNIFISYTRWMIKYNIDKYYVEVVVKGMGKGLNREEKFHNILENIYKLSSLYGEFSVKGDKLSFEVNNKVLEEINITNKTDISMIKLYIGSGEGEGYSYLTYILFSVVAVLAVLIFYLMRRYGLFHR